MCSRNEKAMIIIIKPILLLALLQYCFVAEAEELTIYSSDLEVVQTEAFVFQAIQQKVTQYKLNKVSSGLERGIRNVMHGKGHCVRNLLKTAARSQRLIFSEPFTYFLGLQAFVRPKVKIAALENIITLSQLLAANPKLIVGIEKGRSYGDIADAEIRKIDPQQAYVKQGNDNEAQMLAMLANQRFDLLLEYPSVVSYFLNDNRVRRDDQPRQITLAQFPALVGGRLACIDTPQTRDFIAQVNKHLVLLKQQPAYLKWHLDYIEPQLQELFVQHFRAAIAGEQ